MATDSAVAILGRAEQGIRGLIAEAAAAGEYESVFRLGGVAKRLAEMMAELGKVGLVLGRSPGVSDGNVSPQAAGARRRSGGAVERRGTDGQGYPRFERSKDQLVKVGWSKKDRCEYLHRAPRSVLDVLVREAEKLGAADRIFTADELLPQCRSAAGDDLPHYQLYLCLAWLRSVGLVDQHGRDGYSVSKGDIMDSVNGSWSLLPSSSR
jgi:hypothetical protein